MSKMAKDFYAKPNRSMCGYSDAIGHMFSSRTFNEGSTVVVYVH